MDIQTNLNSGTITTPPPPRQRLTKIKLTNNSFRLGQSSAPPTPVPNGKQRELRFHIPSASELGNGEEAIKIFTIAHSLNESTIGLVSKLAISNGSWVIHLQLSPTGEVNDENEYLSDISRQLAPWVDQLQDLKVGFQRGKGSAWKYCINDFVAAEGNL